MISRGLGSEGRQDSTMLFLLFKKPKMGVWVHVNTLISCRLGIYWCIHDNSTVGNGWQVGLLELGLHFGIKSKPIPVVSPT